MVDEIAKMENFYMFDSNRSPRSNWGSNLPYECLRCGATTMGENIEDRGVIKCIVCGYRVLKKTKPPVVKRVPAR